MSVRYEVRVLGALNEAVRAAQLEPDTFSALQLAAVTAEFEQPQLYGVLEHHLVLHLDIDDVRRIRSVIIR